MTKLLLVVAFLTSCVTGFTQTTPFNITSSLPTFNFRGGAYYYNSSGVTVTTAGSYTFAMGAPSGSFDTYLILYDQSGFNPAISLLNGLTENDDDNEGILGLGSRIVFTLEPGVYTIVGSTFNQLDVGNATLEISGPAAITYGAAPAVKNQIITYDVTPALPGFELGGEQRPHRDTGIRITTPGLYTFQLDNIDGWDSFIALSSTNGFNPAQAEQNLFRFNDDDSIGFLGVGSRITVDLPAGNYVFIATTASQQTGNASLAVSGPAPVTFIPPFFNGILPLHLVAFSAITVNGSAKLNWTSAEDGDGGSYVVQRSKDGRTFTNIQTIPAGKISQTVSYETYDYSLNTGDNYYRILARNKDFSENYSKIVKLTSGFGLPIETVVLSNPSVGSLHLLIRNKSVGAQDLLIELTEVTGRKIRSERKSVRGQLDINYPASPGNYLVRITSPDGSYNWSRQVQIH